MNIFYWFLMSFFLNIMKLNTMSIANVMIHTVNDDANDKYLLIDKPPNRYVLNIQLFDGKNIAYLEPSDDKIVMIFDTM